MRVRLDDIVDGMEMQADEVRSYLHRPTGRVTSISDEALAAAESGEAEWVSAEELADARAILADDAEYLALPDRFEINEYRMMERFALGLTDPSAREAALAALRGRGAFRHFTDTVHRLGLAPSWYEYRDERYRELARSWCEEEGVEYDDAAGRSEG